MKLIINVNFKYNMNTVTLGVYQTRAEAESAIKQLIALGIQHDDISYVY